MCNIQIKDYKNFSIIKPENIVDMVMSGNIATIKYCTTTAHKCSIQKISKDEYFVKETGEVKEFKHKTSRIDLYDALKKTVKSIQNYANYNFTGKAGEYFLTLTYSKKVFDAKELHNDLENFVARMNRKYRKTYGKMEYMSVVEPQANGSWHAHVLIKFPNQPMDKPFKATKKEISNVWCHGFVTVKPITNSDKIGNYLSLCLLDLKMEELDKNSLMAIVNDDALDIKRRDKKVNGESKAFVKNARLHFYPMNLKIYTVSKGMIKPKAVKIRYDVALRILSDSMCKNKYTYNVKTQDDVTVATISHEKYRVSNKVLSIAAQAQEDIKNNSNTAYQTEDENLIYDFYKKLFVEE